MQGAYALVRGGSSTSNEVDDIYGVPGVDKWPMPITTSLQPVAGVNYE